MRGRIDPLNDLAARHALQREPRAHTVEVFLQLGHTRHGHVDATVERALREHQLRAGLDMRLERRISNYESAVGTLELQQVQAGPHVHVHFALVEAAFALAAGAVVHVLDAESAEQPLALGAVNWVFNDHGAGATLEMFLSRADEEIWIELAHPRDLLGRFASFLLEALLELDKALRVRLEDWSDGFGNLGMLVLKIIGLYCYSNGLARNGDLL